MTQNILLLTCTDILRFSKCIYIDTNSAISNGIITRDLYVESEKQLFKFNFEEREDIFRILLSNNKIKYLRYVYISIIEYKHTIKINQK